MCTSLSFLPRVLRNALFGGVGVMRVAVVQRKRVWSAVQLCYSR